MVEVIKRFILDNSTQIWTLFSVVVGGIVTYISTAAAENRKNKRQAQKEKLQQILVPYCTCLEETTLLINTLYQDPDKLYGQAAFSEWMHKLKKPFAYLEAARRVYLSTKMRLSLQKYKADVGTFESELEQEFNSYLIKYKQYISEKLEPFPNLPHMLIDFSMSETTESETKVAILRKQLFSLLDNFTYIDFVENDDPDNYSFTPIKIDDDIRNSWSAINSGVMDISDVEDSDAELSCALLDFIYKNIKDETEILGKFVDKTKSAENLVRLSDLLKVMTAQLVKEIDKITN
jgi:hypothetical protein